MLLHCVQHVIADTLRSIAILVAATVAYMVPTLSPALADSSADMVVSGIIAISLGPLIMNIIHKFNEIRINQKQ